MKRILIPLVIAFLSTAGWLALASWKSLPVYEIASPVALAVPPMTNGEYAEVIGSHARPYVVEIQAAGGAVLIFGADHTKDPEDPQIERIRELWDAFALTVALSEMLLGILFPGLMDSVKTFSEPGAVYRLARRDRIPAWTWEPGTETRMAALLRQPFTPEQIALRVVLGPYFSNRRFGRPDNPEGMVAETVRKRGNWPGIEGILESVEDVDAAWRRHFPEGPDWREVSDEYGLPGFLAGIDDNLARDEHFAQVVIDLVRKGERVFAVAGVSHAVKLEPTLHAVLAP